MPPLEPSLIDRWFPLRAVDAAARIPAGSGKIEKALFPWFASRPVAQARAAVLGALLPDDADVRRNVEVAVRSGAPSALVTLAQRIAQRYPSGRPVVLDMFSGRAIIPLEAARLGATAVAVDLSPVATLAGRVLAEWSVRDWSPEPAVPFAAPAVKEFGAAGVLLTDPRGRFVPDSHAVHAEVGRRVQQAMAPHFPANPDGTRPWGYLWAVTVPCDTCQRRYPLVGSLALRQPYAETDDPGQSFRVVVDGEGWRVEVVDGPPDQLPTFRAPRGKRGKSAHCPFCGASHSLLAIKAKGAAREYHDVPLLAAESDGASEGTAKKGFRALRPEERAAALSAAATLATLGAAGADPGKPSVVPDEAIPAGNEHTVRPSGYGYRRYGDLMCARQTLHVAETVVAIRACHRDLRAAGLSDDYAAALTGTAAAALARQLKYTTRGARLQVFGKPNGAQHNRSAVGHVFAEESKLSFNFDFFETGLGVGPGTWTSIAHRGMQALSAHVTGLRRVDAAAPAPLARPARVLRASALALPFRDGTVDAVVTDPPYYAMIDYADASDLFYVWMRRVLYDVLPSLFGAPGLQDKTDEIIVKDGGDATEHRTRDFYQQSLARAFGEARRVLRPDGHLVVVFGHSDPDAWIRLLAALHAAGFVVTSSWPSRTESANTGKASIKVTVSIGCRVAPADRPSAVVAQVDREVQEAVHARVRGWERDDLALMDQLMASYGPAMEVYGRYARVLDFGREANLERYLTLARATVREAAALKLDSIPLETFDPPTRFAMFWLRLHGRTPIPKGEARFLAQADSLRLESVRGTLLGVSERGYRLVLDRAVPISPSSPVIDVVRSLAAAYRDGGDAAVAAVLSDAVRPPDDVQVWAVVAELVRQLPASDHLARALTGVQRNRGAIQQLSRGIASAGEADAAQFTFDALTPEAA